MEEGEKLTWQIKLRHKLREYWRVLRITKKPSGDEFKIIVKVSALGMAIIGFIGFIVHIIQITFF